MTMPPTIPSPPSEGWHGKITGLISPSSVDQLRRLAAAQEPRKAANTSAEDMFRRQNPGC